MSRRVASAKAPRQKRIWLLKRARLDGDWLAARPEGRLGAPSPHKDKQAGGIGVVLSEMESSMNLLGGPVCPHRSRQGRRGVVG